MLPSIMLSFRLDVGSELVPVWLYFGSSSEPFQFHVGSILAPLGVHFESIWGRLGVDLDWMLDRFGLICWIFLIFVGGLALMRSNVPQVSQTFSETRIS